MEPDFDALKFLQSTMRNLPASDQLEFVLARIAKASGCAIVAFDAQGDVLASIGDVAARMFWEFAADATPDATGQVGRWNLRVRRSGPSGGVFTLVFGSRESKNIHDIGALVDAADVAVTAVLGAIRGTDVRRMRDNAQLLETLEHGIQTAREHRYWPRLVEFGFAAHSPFLMVVSESSVNREPTQDLIAEILDSAAAEGVPILLATRLIAATSDSVVHALVPDTSLARQWLHTFEPTSSMGLSLPHTALADVPTAVREAEHAQRVALVRSRARLRTFADASTVGEIVDYRTLRLTDWAIVEAPAREFRARRRQLLSVFDSHETILDTVITYLATNLSVPQTAELLFLHSNTVRYRLGKAEELLGDSIASPFVLAELVMALSPEIKIRSETLAT